MDLTIPDNQRRILCAGMLMCDIPIHTVPFNIMNLEIVKIGTFKPTTGGDALNVAKTLHKLGSVVSIAGKVGADQFGDFIVHNITTTGINTDYIIKDSTVSTSVSFHLIDQNGKAHTHSSSPIHEKLCAEDFSESAFRDVKIIYFGSALVFPKMDNDGISALFKQAHNAGILTAMDTALDRTYISGEEEYRRLEPAFSETDIFLPSFREASFLTGAKEIHAIAERMNGFGIKVFGIKLGDKGCYLTDFKDEYYISAFNEFKPKDTIGAGDSFFGAFLHGYSLGWEIAECGSLASLVSSFNIAVVGATDGVPDFRTATDYLADHPAKIEKRPYV
jgi:sugar/nucleoside kinase (ribokinase family)